MSRVFINKTSTTSQDEFKIPIIIGLPGIAKLSTLLKYSLSCGIGNSVNFLKKQGSNVLNLVRTQEPNDMVRKLSNSEEALKENNIEGVHIYPLGGKHKSSDWANAIIDKKIKLTPTGFSVNY